VITRSVGIGPIYLTLGAAPGSPQNSPQHPELVWTSAQSGQPLAGGRVMTQPQALFRCLTHTRNEVIESQSTPTRITYRTLDGTVLVYEGTCPSSRRTPPTRRPAFKTLSGVYITPENVKERAAAVRAAMGAHAVLESSLRTMRALLGELTTTTNVVRRQVEAMEGSTP
jgi:hypothetical protein